MLIGFNCWPIGFQVQKRVSRTKTSVNLGPWERLATLLVSNIKDFIQLHMPLGCRGPREACPHRSDVLFFFFFKLFFPHRPNSRHWVQLLEIEAWKYLTYLVPCMFLIFIPITLFLAVMNYHVKKRNDWKYF